MPNIMTTNILHTTHNSEVSTDYIDQLPDCLAQIQNDWKTLQYSWREDVLIKMQERVQRVSQVPTLFNAEKAGETLENIAQMLELVLSQLSFRQQAPTYTERGNIIEQLAAMAKVAEQLHAQYATEDSDAPPSPDHKIVCLLTQDHDLQSTLRGYLQQQGYELRLLKDIKALLQVVRLFTPLAVLVDISYQQADLHIAKVIYTLQKSRSVPLAILFLAAKNHMSARLIAVRAGSMGFFVKPFQHQDISHKLSEIHHRRKAQQNRVLLIDDKGAYVHQYVSHLAESGFIISHLDNPLQILEALQRHAFALVLVKMEMRQLTGFELTKIIRQQQDYLHLPVVVITAKLEQTLSQTAVQGIADDVINDQISPERLSVLLLNRIRHARQRQQWLQQVAEHDKLTGLYNRDYVRRYLQNYRLASKDSQQQLAIFYIDLSHTQTDAMSATPIIDSEEHLLLNAARILRNWNETDDLLAVWRDQVLLLIKLQNQANQDDLQSIGSALAQRIKQKLVNPQQRYYLKQCHIGISLLKEPEQNPQTLIWSARQACAEALRINKNCVVYTRQDDGLANSAALNVDKKDPDDQAKRIENDHYVLECLQKALQNEADNAPCFQFAYQPIARVHGENHAYYDILLRLQGENQDIMMPNTFFQIASQAEKLIEIDRWVINHALQALQQKYQNQEAVRFFIKISQKTLQDDSFTTWLSMQLNQVDIPHDALIIDIGSHSAINKDSNINHFVRNLKALGCAISLRDFLYEPTHLALLEALSIDFIKIHPSLIQALENNADDMDKVKKIVDKGHARACLVIGICVEKADSLSLLWQIEIDYIAGHFVQSPDHALDFDFAET